MIRQKGQERACKDSGDCVVSPVLRSLAISRSRRSSPKCVKSSKEVINQVPILLSRERERSRWGFEYGSFLEQRDDMQVG